MHQDSGRYCKALPTSVDLSPPLPTEKTAAHSYKSSSIYSQAYNFTQQYPLVQLRMKPTMIEEEKPGKRSFSGTAARDAADDRMSGPPAFLVPAAQLPHNKTSIAPPSRPFTPFIVGLPSQFPNTLHWTVLGPYSFMPLHVADDTPLFAEREDWADVQPLEQYEGVNPIAPIFYTAQCEFGPRGCVHLRPIVERLHRDDDTDNYQR